MPADQLPAYVPPQYANWVTTAATDTGLPVSVVAAQIDEESGFNPLATSSAGAEGIAQFEPATYAAVGGHGSEYNAQNELQPYINLTNENLTWSGGNVAKALAAYNAGQGNWQAGVGYANTILSNAGQQSQLTATPGNVNASSQNTPTGSGNPSGGGFNPLNPASWISTDTWERLGLILFGAILVLVGVYMLAGKQTIKIASTAAKAAAA